MNRVHSTAEKPVSQKVIVAVAVCAVDEQQRHVAILHREGGRLNRLDLAWHFRLRNERFDSSRYLWIDVPIDRLRAVAVAAKCRQVWRANRHGRIPYGFSPPTDCFDHRALAYLVGRTRHGLTCASFVLAVFHKAGVRLVDYESWPVDRPGDREWQEMVIRKLEDAGADESHIHALRSDIGAVRFRPEEVAAAATQPPCGFDVAVEVAQEIVEKLPPYE